MKMLPKVSIIVPAYNAGKYIGRCLDSLLSQTFTEIEIIVVNDGSTDTTHAVCYGYTARDERVILVEIPNGGVSNARNVGIEKARGEWLMFVDADDWLDNNVVKSLIDLQKETGLSTVVYSFIFEYGNFSKELKIADGILEVGYIIENSNDVLNPDAILCSPCNKLYSKSIINDNRIRFDITLKFAEDFVFNSLYFSFIKRIVCTGHVTYHYDCSIQNSGVKKLYTDYDRILSVMTYSFDHLVDNSQCDTNKTSQYRQVFIGQRWIYALSVLIESSMGIDEKADMLYRWLQSMPHDILGYLSNSNPDFHRIATNYNGESKSKIFLKEVLFRIAFKNKYKFIIMKIKSIIKQILSL